MKAWIENNTVRDIAQGIPSEVYMPEIAALYNTDIPDGTERGATLIDDVWTNPPASYVLTTAELEAKEAGDLAASEQLSIQEAGWLYQEEVSAMIEGYLQSEIDSWPTQEDEAVAFTQNAEAATPLLDAMIAKTGETKEALAAKIIEKAGQFKQAFGTSLGKKRKAEQT